MGSLPGQAYKDALKNRAEEIAWAKASIEKKFEEPTQEARRAWLAHKQGRNTKYRRQK